MSREPVERSNENRERRIWEEKISPSSFAASLFVLIGLATAMMLPAKGGVRRKYGGSTTRHGFRKGDLVKSPKGVSYVSGDTERQVSVSDANWKRLGQIASSKVQLIRRSNGLIVT